VESPSFAQFSKQGTTDNLTIQSQSPSLSDIFYEKSSHGFPFTDTYFLSLVDYIGFREL
jgi:hypothetical protein